MLHQLYQPAEESKELQSTVLNKPHEQIGIDLVDISNYNYDNYRYNGWQLKNATILFYRLFKIFALKIITNSWFKK